MTEGRAPALRNDPAPLVGIVMGSISDLRLGYEAFKVLGELGVPRELAVRSVHRTPDLAREYALTARQRGIKVIIAIAGGGAAHLPGMMASWADLPVIGVPAESASPVKDLGSLLSISQMPAGVPVAGMAVGRAGAVNAAILAATILGAFDERIHENVVRYRRALAAESQGYDQRLREEGVGAFLDAGGAVRDPRG